MGREEVWELFPHSEQPGPLAWVNTFPFVRKGAGRRRSFSIRPELGFGLYTFENKEIN